MNFPWWVLVPFTLSLFRIILDLSWNPFTVLFWFRDRPPTRYWEDFGLVDPLSKDLGVLFSGKWYE